MMRDLFDKTGRVIRHGDVLKVFHFTGPRGKKHYMYKQVIGSFWLGSRQYAKIGNLNMAPPGDWSSYYTLALDGSKLDDYKIVQGCGDDYRDRVKFTFAEKTS